jgi:hypothetical protein
MGFKDGGSGGNTDSASDLADRAIDKAKKNGRKDAGQEQEPDKKALKEALPGVIKVIKAENEAKTATSDKCKSVGKKTGFLAHIVRAAAKAAMAEDETRELSTRKAEQMSLALEVAESVAK